jgi:hypothetical protein
LGGKLNFLLRSLLRFFSGNVAQWINRKAPDESRILISMTPGPTVFIGFQSVGSRPFCTSSAGPG